MRLSITGREATDCLAALLTKAGAKPARYGKRWDCPRCGRSGRVSVDVGKGVFHCWHAGCDFKGSIFTLARELGVTQALNSAEARAYRERQLRGERIKAELKVQYRKLAAEHRDWLALITAAESRLETNMDDEVAWSAMALAYRKGGPLWQRLESLEDEIQRQSSAA